MKTLKFETQINAPKEKVWKTLWEDATYRQWTNVFSPGSHAKSDWKEGSKMFLSPEGEGMFSTISKLVPNETMHFTHLGMVREGKEQSETPESKAWSGSKENYELKTKNGGTELLVAIDITEEHESYFKETFPKALEAVKKLSEN